MAEIEEVARVLGVSLPLHETGALSYMLLVKRGFPVKSLDRIASELAPRDANFKYRIVPKATLARTRLRRRLNAPQSVLVARLASIWTQALRVWKSAEAAREFLTRAHPMLEERRPIDLVLENEIGAELVRGVLGRLESGVAA